VSSPLPGYAFLLTPPSNRLNQNLWGSGLRAGEILGLRVEDLDFERGLINVHQAALQGNIQTVKTEESENGVVMTRLVEEIHASVAGCHAKYGISRTHPSRTRAQVLVSRLLASNPTVTASAFLVTYHAAREEIIGPTIG
jgi:integrase